MLTEGFWGCFKSNKTVELSWKLPVWEKLGLISHRGQVDVVNYFFYLKSDREYHRLPDLSHFTKPNEFLNTSVVLFQHVMFLLIEEFQYYCPFLPKWSNCSSQLLGKAIYLMYPLLNTHTVSLHRWPSDVFPPFTYSNYLQTTCLYL